MKQYITIIIYFLIYLLHQVTATAQGLPDKIFTVQEGTVLLDSNKKEVSHQPFEIAKVLPDMKYTISNKSYEPIFIQLKKNKKGLNFPKDLSTCYPCLMEFKETPLAENATFSGKFRLRKKMPENQHSIMIALITPEIKLNPDDIVADINGKKIKFKNEDIHLTMGYPQNLFNPFIRGFNNTYIDAHDIDACKEEKTRLYKPKIIVKPVIKKLEYKFEGKYLRDYNGPASVQIEWQFFFIDDTTRAIGKIISNTSIYRISETYELPMHELVFEASRDLVECDTLYNYLEKQEQLFLSKTYPPPIKIAHKANQNFPNQKEMLKSFSSAVVVIENDEEFGSGVIIDPSGIVLTNHHVIIEDTTEIRVRVKGKSNTVVATIIAKNSDYDLALLKLPEGTYPFMTLTSSDSLESGDGVFAIGTPLDKSLSQSVTRGIVSGFREFNAVKFIQTDVTINAGNSGGALVTDDGKFIGIATMKAVGKGIEGLGFCIPASTINAALNLKY